VTNFVIHEVVSSAFQVCWNF